MNNKMIMIIDEKEISFSSIAETNTNLLNFNTMNQPLHLTETLLQNVSTSVREKLMALPHLEQALQQIINVAHQAWPTIQIPTEEYLSFLASRLNKTDEAPDSFLSWKTDDLYLVCGCLAGMSEALFAFEKQLLSRIEAQLMSILKSPILVSDLRQSLLQELFLADGEAEPKINGYQGRKELSNWVMVVAVRKAINLFNQLKKEYPLLEQDLNQLPILEEDPELQYLKVLYHQEFATAFQQAIASLSPTERNILRYYLIDGLNIEHLGAMYKVHRATAARWLAKIRQKLLSKTRQTLMKSLQVGSEEYESIIRLIQSQLNASIMEHLNRKYE